MIELRGVSKVYEGGWPALTDINLKIEKGEFCFLYGPTGAGKSTILRLLYREELPTGGSIKVLDYDLVKLNSRTVPFFRRRLGMIFQDFKLLMDRTVCENVAFALEIIGGKGIKQKTLQVLEQVGLSHKVNSFPYELSGGEQQKVALARALVKEPFILLADEPTGNIDPKGAAEVLELFVNINFAGTTIVMATHNDELITKVRKRIIRLETGRVVEDVR